MAEIDHLYAEFVRAWNAGDAPELDVWLDRAAAADRDELADRIELFALMAPSVELRPERAAALRSTPAFAAAAALQDAAARPWGARLRAARERAGLSLAELGGRFAASFHETAGRDEKATLVLSRLEDGDAPATGVTRRAADRLAELLGLTGGALAPPPRPQALFRRAAGAAGAPALASEPSAPATPPASGGARRAAASPAELAAYAFLLDPGADLADWDGVDDLLRGGESSTADRTPADDA